MALRVLTALAPTRDFLRETARFVRTSAPGWVGGALAGLQAALFSFALVLIPVWVVTTSAAHATVSWSDATTNAARMWLLGLAVPWSVQQVPITLVPLGLSVLTMLMLAQLVRRFASVTWVAGTAAVVTFMAVSGFIAATAWDGDPLAGARLLRALAVSGVVALPATAWGLMRSQGAYMPWIESLRPEVKMAARSATATFAGIVGISALVLVASGLAHAHRIADAATALGVDAPGGVALASMQTLYSPNLVAWTGAWLTGAGFGAGESIQTSAAGVSALPHLPLFEALPGVIPVPFVAPLSLILVGAVIQTIATRGKPSSVRSLSADAAGVLVSAAALAVLVRVSQGSIGPGALAHVGAPALLTAGLAACWLGIGTASVWALKRAWLMWKPPIRRSSAIQTSRSLPSQNRRHTASSQSA